MNFTDMGRFPAPERTTTGTSYTSHQGVFLDASGKRVGGFYRLQAARAFLESGDDRRCPVTGQPIASVKEVPSILEDLEAAKDWTHLYKYFDGQRRV